MALIIGIGMVLAYAIVRIKGVCEPPVRDWNAQELAEINSAMQGKNPRECGRILEQYREVRYAEICN